MPRRLQLLDDPDPRNRFHHRRIYLVVDISDGSSSSAIPRCKLITHSCESGDLLPETGADTVFHPLRYARLDRSCAHHMCSSLGFVAVIMWGVWRNSVVAKSRCCQILMWDCKKRLGSRMRGWRKDWSVWTMEIDSYWKIRRWQVFIVRFEMVWNECAQSVMGVWTNGGWEWYCVELFDGVGIVWIIDIDSLIHILPAAYLSGCLCNWSEFDSWLNLD